MSKKNHKYAEKLKSDWKTPSPAPAEISAGDHAKVRISFEYYQTGSDLCLSACSRDDVKIALDCLRRLTGMPWIQVLQTATKDRSQKTGLHWTSYDDTALKVKRPAEIGSDHTICGIRAGGKFRIFGFRMGPAFHVVWFDPEHKVCAG